jgi:hypothetical protein
MRNITLLFALIGLLIVVGCVQDDEVGSEVVVETAVTTPTQTPIPPTFTPQSTNTETPIPATTILNQTPSPTNTSSPTTSIEHIIKPTAIPLDVSKNIPSDMQNKEYEILFSTSFVGPDSLEYSVYAFKDSELTPEFGGETNSDICHLAFYHWDGTQNEIIADFGAATYPENARFGGFPVNCSLANWDDDGWFTDIWGGHTTQI